jgi:hypothetical protein
MIGFWQRITFAFRCWYGILAQAKIPRDIAEQLTSSAPVVEVTTAKPIGAIEKLPAESPGELPVVSFDRAVQILALLQRDGRLIDFLAEDIAPYPDAQLGAAVRAIHESCRKVLDDYVKMEPIIASDEDKSVTVQAGFDPAAIRLIGTVTGEPPLRGLLRHRGWRVKEIHLPTLPAQDARLVVAPAEVEIP